MTSDQCKSSFYEEFCSGIEIIKKQSNDEFHNKLYFSNVISLMEKYLYNLFIHEISSNREAIVELETQKLSAHFLSCTVVLVPEIGAA